jgi:YkoY family integral membrane protein
MDWLTFFHLHDFAQTWPTDLMVVLVLIVLEGLLSCDNAVVLALLVKHLPPEQRGRALRYGIIGAYVFRIIALMLAVWIMSQWYLKVLGGLYLVWLGATFFLKKKAAEPAAGEEPPPVRRWFGLNPFWSTVIAVELTDIVFSVDSIAAAVALTDKLWVLIVGALAGILVMRFAAQGFVVLLEKFPRLEACAFAAVLFIGLKLTAELPGDVVGRQAVFPPEVVYHTRDEYRAAVDRHCPPTWEVGHVVTINSAAAPAPEAFRFLGATAAALVLAQPDRVAVAERIHAAFAANEATTVTVAGTDLTVGDAERSEYRRAYSLWNLHLRPLFEVEGWVSSIIVATMFAFGFIRPRRKTD